MADPAGMQRMLLPRLPAVAEVGWSLLCGHDWDDFARRIAGHGRRWAAEGRAWTAVDEVAWGLSPRPVD
ncbi:hypothetical protein [Streptomyces sp. NBC_00046]|uniref:hypothetical protein n=1 Tax=unclassified Streptomyces TaxID=2593676 RepID=UPI00324EAB02